MPQDPLLNLEILTEAIRRRPNDPLVQMARRHLEYEKALGAVGISDPADRVVAAAQLLATLTRDTMPRGDDAPWRKVAASVVDAARGNDLAVLRGVAEAAPDAMPQDERGALKWRMEDDAFDALEAAGTEVGTLAFALELVNIVPAEPLAAEWLVPAAALLAMAFDGDQLVLAERVRDLAGSGNASERTGGLFVLLLTFFTIGVANNFPDGPLAVDMDAPPWLFASDFADQAAIISPVRRSCARLLAQALAAVHVGQAERDDLTGQMEAELLAMTERGEVWMPEMLWLLVLAAGNWTRRIGESQAAETVRTAGGASRRPRPMKRKPRNRKQ